ncbi:MAG TPA: hypothetical protein VKM93_15040 [Terriglobia bacterium]|nr:hypothetical protein [Terriglobia bacterium]
MALESLKELLRLGGRVRRLVVAHGVSGVQVHDARLVAAMRVYGVRSVLTFNGSDFSRYSEVQVMHPGQVAGLREDRGEH